MKKWVQNLWTRLQAGGLADLVLELVIELMVQLGTLLERVYCRPIQFCVPDGSEGLRKKNTAHLDGSWPGDV